MAEEEAAAAPVVKGEHAVSIVLSYMDDEHEKAAIEVRVFRAKPPSVTPLGAERFGLWLGSLSHFIFSRSGRPDHPLSHRAGRACRRRKIKK